MNFYFFAHFFGLFGFGIDLLNTYPLGFSGSKNCWPSASAPLRAPNTAKSAP
jgi:hypothetical protein